VAAQSNDIAEEYYNFLKGNRDIGFPESSALYPLQSSYFQALTDDDYLDSFAFLDSVNLKFNLTIAEKEKLAKNGFVVTERVSYEKFLDALRDIYHKDLPVMITTDMMLYALHASYDAILKKLEVDQLRPNLFKILGDMRNSYDLLVTKYSGHPEFESSLKDIDLYISIPLALLGKVSAPLNPANNETFNLLLSSVKAEQGFVVMPLFSEHSRKLDFSQFKTRGHYNEVFDTPTGPDSLAAYFKAMIWLGRMDFLLTPPPAYGEEPWSEEDIWRMNASALLLDDLIDISGVRGNLYMSEKIIDLLVGESDNLTPSELTNTRTRSGISSVSDILDTTKYNLFKQELNSSPESGQKILSDIFIVDPFSTTPDPLPVSFRLMGQRFIIDSYFFSQLVYDRIIFQDEKIWRPLPSPLDASFILGNNDALNLLQDEINTYHYATQLSSLRKLTDLYDTTFWQQSLYNSWLSCLRELNKKPDWEDMPFFLSSAAWQHEKLNTQLASWAQLRHDNLLYAKQSYTGGASCSYPHSYIEPYPGFYNALSTFAARAGTFFKEINADQSINDYFQKMQTTCDTLSMVLNKQIANELLTENEINFLKNMYSYDHGGCVMVDNGWFFDLLFDEGKESVVADVHTQPTDKWGNIVGNILHVGTGKVDLGIFLANGPTPGNEPMVFVGPVMSYYETVTNNFYRYNDKEWINVFPGLARPEWTSIYLAKKNGNSSEKGSELPYETVKVSNPISNISNNAQIVFAFPNPTSNYISIRNASVNAQLFIYDIQGRLVCKAKNDQNTIDLTNLYTGVYILKLVDQGKTQTSKIVKE
jgi:hypothetical protein